MVFIAPKIEMKLQIFQGLPKENLIRFEYFGFWVCYERLANQILQSVSTDRGSRLDLRDFTFPMFFSRICGYIDVGDGCWRPNVLVTKFRRW